MILGPASLVVAGNVLHDRLIIAPLVIGCGLVLVLVIYTHTSWDRG